MSSSVNKAYLVSSLALISVTTAPLKTTRVNSEEYIKCKTETCITAVYCLIMEYTSSLYSVTVLTTGPGGPGGPGGP